MSILTGGTFRQRLMVPLFPNTLEYAYDDWCIAQLTKKPNRPDVYETYLKRSENWRNVYDRSIGFMRPRLTDGSFKKEFDVYKTDGQGFIEGNFLEFQLFSYRRILRL